MKIVTTEGIIFVRSTPISVAWRGVPKLEVEDHGGAASGD